MSKPRNFDTEAAQWDENPGRVKLANDVADAIIKTMDLRKDMDMLDFGCGTGLVTLRLQPYVRTITGLDSSKGMLGILEGKIAQLGLENVKTEFVDFETGGSIKGEYDLIISSMTVHHVPDTAALFRMWYGLLKPEGKICFADLDTEDGSFHSDNTGVFHFGFNREELKNLLNEARFSEVRDTTAAKVVKESEGSRKEFSVFLIEGKR